MALHALFSLFLYTSLHIGSIDAICAVGQSSTITCTEPNSWKRTADSTVYCNWYEPDRLNKGWCQLDGVCDVCVCACKQDSSCAAGSITHGTVEVCRTCLPGFRGDGLTCTLCGIGEVSTNPMSGVCVAAPVSKCPVTRSLSCKGGCACSPTTSQNTGTITDGQYNYQPNSNCEYLFTSSSTVSLMLTEFVTEERWDVFIIEICTTANCASSTRLLRAEGTTALGVYYSTDAARPFMRVTFTSDQWREYAGFKANWVIRPPILQHCDADFIVPNCLVGEYADSYQCWICPINSVSPANSTAVASCVCNAGYSGLNQGICTKYAVGKYRSPPRNTSV